MKTIKKTFRNWLRRKLGFEIGADQVEWVANDLDELGVKINGRYFFLYKGTSLEYNGFHDDGTPMKFRPVGKREFGESVHPVMQESPCNSSD